jgi:CheY-like chemotaxis protein
MSRILVVDPAPHIRRLMGAILEGTHEVIEAADGETALGHVYADRPDLVLCELLLQDLSGFEFSRLVRGDPDLDAVRLVAVTGSLDPLVRQYALDARFDAFVTKPFRPAALRALVDALIHDASGGFRAVS